MRHRKLVGTLEFQRRETTGVFEKPQKHVRGILSILLLPLSFLCFYNKLSPRKMDRFVALV